MAKKEEASPEAETPGTSLAVPTANKSVVADVGGFGEFANGGLDNVGAADLLVPRLTILQDLSPQLKSTKTEYIEGAKPGDICDVGTGELFPNGIMFLPIFYRKDYLEWAPRKSGKGLIAIHSDPAILDQCSRDNEKNQPMLNGNLIAETAQMFGLNLSADGRKSFIPMASTQLKKSRKWLTLATGEKLAREDGSTFTPPLFYRAYLLTTAQESNSEGDWFGWKVERGPTLPELQEHGFDWQGMKQESVDFLNSLVEGKADIDKSQMDDGGAPIIDNEEGGKM